MPGETVLKLGSSPHQPPAAFRRARRAVAGAGLAALVLLASACGGGGDGLTVDASVTAADEPHASDDSRRSAQAARLAPTLAGSTAAGGTPSTTTAAATTGTAVDPNGITPLFAQIGTALASASACAGPNGLAAALSAQARLDTPSQRFAGAAPVAAALCAWFADDKLWGSTLAAPSPNRCAVRDGQAGCRVAFELQAADGSTRRLGRQLAVVQESGGWKLKGHVDPIDITAFASTQRERRLDSGVTVDRYARGLVLAIPTAPGLACARVTQTDAAGQRSTLAYFKPYEGLGVQRLSLWRTGAAPDQPRSTNPRQGDLRVVDDSYLALPDGAAGDAIVNNLVRDGGNVRVALYADAACSTPFGAAAQAEYDVGVEGVPPLSTTLATQGWPGLSTTSAGDLRRLGLNSLASANFTSGWTMAGFRPELLMLCVDDAHCGEGDDGRVGERTLARSATLGTLTVKNRKAPVVPADFKLLALYGRAASGTVMLADFHSCASTPAGQPCPTGM